MSLFADKIRLIAVKILSGEDSIVWNNSTGTR
jgi:hypothetical protein